ncbi:MAG: hypothetical protein M0P77_00895 [Firmicutes bacterium]|nr:hypothetical protein [Bacillota bacterium]
MSLFKNIGSKAMSTARIVGNKTQEMAEIGKLKIQINQLESDIKKLKTEIGEAVYKAYIEKLDSPLDQINDLCSIIDEKYNEIEELKIKIEKVKSN